MFRSIRRAGFAVTAIIFTTATLAHAADDYLAQIYGDDNATKAQWSAGAKLKTETPRNPRKKRCDGNLTAANFVPGASLELTETKNEVEEILINLPIVVGRENPAVDDEENKAAQVAKMRENGHKVANLILSPQYFGSESAQLDIQTLLHTEVGLLPKASLAIIGGNLDVSMSEINDSTRKPRFRRDADNALAELTRVVTSYQKNGLDINGIANFSARLADLPVIGGQFKGVDVILRERFQTFRQAIIANDSVFERSVAQMLVRLQQMRISRLEARALERYLELNLEMIDAMKIEFNAHLETRNSSPDQEARFKQLILLPLAMTEQFIERNQAVVMAAYQSNAIHMNQLNNFIGMVRNVRTTAEISATTFGRDAIEENENEKTMNLMTDTFQAIDVMTQVMVDRIRRNSGRARGMPKLVIDSTAKLIGHLDSLIDEMRLVQEGDSETLRLLNRANPLFRSRLAEARRKGEKYNLIGLVDDVIQELTGRSADEVDAVPGAR